MATKKKLLIITFNVPYPATDGGQMSIFGTVNYLRKFFDITLLLKVQTEAELLNTQKLKTIWPEVTIEYVNFSVPTSKSYERALTLYRPIVRLKERFKKALGHAPEASRTGTIEFHPFPLQPKKLLDALEGLLSKNKYDIIQVEHSSMLNLVQVLPADTKTVFVQIENQYSLMADYFVKEKDQYLFGDYIVKCTQYIEVGQMQMYDFIFALSRKDKNSLSQFIPDDKMVVAPFPILDSLVVEEEDTTLRTEAPDKMIFLGSQAHPPNKDAVEWFATEMYPSIRAKHNIQLYVTGKWEESFKSRFPDIIFTGFVDDLSALMKKSISISPIRLGGGGIRAKVLQAMAMRTPLVCTSLGCEGIETIQDHENVMMADTAAVFISAIDELMTNGALRQNIVHNAYNVIQQFYSEKAAGEVRRKIYDTMLATAVVAQ